MAEINTIIQLRNDTAEKWATEAGQATPLKPGEVAVEIVDGKAKLKIGTSADSTFGNSEYFGSDVKEAQVYQSEILKSTDEQDDIAVIESLIPEGVEVQNGDIAIVKRYITGESGAVSYTSYVYDSSYADETSGNPGWAATDGNYSASNVFLKNKIELAGSFSSIGNYSKGKTIDAGTSLESLLSGMLQQEIYPGDTGYAIDLPSASISASGSEGKVEVGNTFTLPTATLKITDVGSYPFAPTATGITFAVGNVTLSQGGNKTSNTTVLSANGTVTLKATGSNTTYGDDPVSFTFTGTAAYDASPVTPKTNLGNEYPSKKIAAGSCTVSDKTVSFTGYRKWFKGGDTSTDFSSSTIRKLTNSSSAVTSHTFEIKAADYSGCSRIVIAIPTKANKKISKVYLKSSSNADITGEFKKINTTDNVINVEGYNGYTAVSYDVWEYKPASLDSTEVYTITIA